MFEQDRAMERRDMARTVSAAEAKNHFGAMMEAVREGENVIVQRHGKPEMVMIAYDAYEQTEEMRKLQKRADALARLEALRERVQARNSDLTDEQAEEIAEEISLEALRRLAERGEITFERDSF